MPGLGGVNAVRNENTQALRCFKNTKSFSDGGFFNISSLHTTLLYKGEPNRDYSSPVNLLSLVVLGRHSHI